MIPTGLDAEVITKIFNVKEGTGCLKLFIGPALSKYRHHSVYHSLGLENEALSLLIYPGKFSFLEVQKRVESFVVNIFDKNREGNESSEGFFSENDAVVIDFSDPDIPHILTLTIPLSPFNSDSLTSINVVVDFQNDALAVKEVKEEEKIET